MKFNAVVLLAASLANSLAAVVSVPRGEPQLFLDDSRIESAIGLQRTLRQPKKDDNGDRPVLSIPDMFGFGTTLEAYGTIVRDPRLDRWVMYCQAYVPAVGKEHPERWQRTHFLRYTSADGLTWESDSPDGMDRVFPLSPKDFLDPAGQPYAAHVDSANFWYDTGDPVWPYKAWFWLYKRGIHYARSRDGRTFELGAETIVPYQALTLEHAGHKLLGPDDVTRFSPDPQTGRFLALLKFMRDRTESVTSNQLRSRAFLFFDRLDQPVDLSGLDHVELVPALAQERGDFPFDEYYDSTAWRYGSHWLGELRIWHRRGDYPWSPAGAAYLKLISSLDGLRWSRVSYPNEDGVPEVFVANNRPEGGNGGRNDGGYMSNFSQGPLRIGDELVLYYGASSYGKNAGDRLRMTGGGIFRARLRLDGFVSVDAGRLTTLPLRFEGDRLLVNSAGAVQVEVLGENGETLGTARLSADAVRQPVRFGGRSLREAAAGRDTVRLRFTVETGAALYAFLID